MDPNVLRDHLTKLHEELRTAPHAPPGSSQLLGELMEDIGGLMARTQPGNVPPGGAGEPAAAPATGDGPASLSERLEKIAVLFEVDHPTLATSSRRLVDMLGKVGL